MGKQIVEAPMVAYSTTRNIEFRNVGALSLFKLKTEGSGQVELQRITISSDRALYGNYSITWTTDDWTADASALSGTHRTLICSNPMTLNTSAKPFYLYLPPVENATTITVDISLIINGVQRHFSKTKSGTINLIAGKCYDFGTLTFNTSTQTLTDNNSVNYEEIEPAGTESDPYRISNASEWYYWCEKYASESDKHFLIENDFTVANSIAEMKGTVDGNGHTITVSNCALIDYLNGGTVKNITTNGTITTYSYNAPYRKTCGVLAAYASNVTLTNCCNQANIQQSTSVTTFDVGGLIGYLDNSNGAELNNCRNEGNIIGNAEIITFNLGGIVGNISGSSTHLINCCNTGAIQHNSNSTYPSYIGGLIGTTAGSGNKIVENCYSIGEISGVGQDKRGGIIGSSKTTIQNCYCYSNDVTLPLCYDNRGTIKFCYHYGTNCVISNETGASFTDCCRLSNATTINRAESNNLAEQLNENRNTLNIIATARRWVEANGYTVFEETNP